jgi:hypothetical protein
MKVKVQKQYQKRKADPIKRKEARSFAARLLNLF